MINGMYRLNTMQLKKGLEVRRTYTLAADDPVMAVEKFNRSTIASNCRYRSNGIQIVSVDAV